jgi:tetratricopeptide (TPR) repeat protein
MQPNGRVAIVVNACPKAEPLKGNVWSGNQSRPSIAPRGLWYAAKRGSMETVNAKDAFRRGVALVNDGKMEAALEAFQDGLQNTARKKEQGPLLYNIAACQLHLGKDGLAIDALDKALDATPRLVLRARKDREFDRVRNTDQFHSMCAKHRWRYVRTWKWYLLWCTGALLAGLSWGVLSQRSDPIDRAAQLGGMSIPLAWFVGKLIEAIFAFKHSVVID